MKIRKVLTGVGLTIAFACVSFFAVAAQLTEKAKEAIATESLEGRVRIKLAKDYPEAIKRCRNAQTVAAKYDHDPFFDAFIARCFAEAARFHGDKQEACAFYRQAMTGYEATPAGHAYYPAAKSNLENARKEKSELGC
jgi:hypothetical protein